MHPSSKSGLVFATNNIHKFGEIEHLLINSVNLLKLDDIGFTDEIPETQFTIEGNAAQKAFYIYERYGLGCFADDTGLEISSLNGEPGVFSARYAGNGCTFSDNIELVLKKMNGKVDRNAVFRTVIALVEKGKLTLFEGKIEGTITLNKKGLSGFGYDPIFQPKGFKKTFAEMTLKEKNEISHRAIAINHLIDYLKKKDLVPSINSKFS